MTGCYQLLGMNILYPENWSVCDERDDDWPQTVTFQSPGSAFWSVHVVRRSSGRALDLADEVLKSIREDYGPIDVESARESLEDQSEAIGYDIQFFYLDFIVTAHLVCFECGQFAYVILFQAEDREFEEREMVFRAILTSLLRQLDQATDSARSN